MWSAVSPRGLGESWHRFEVAIISTVIRIKAVQRLAVAA
jgi:hypothetical protein